MKKLKNAQIILIYAMYFYVCCIRTHTHTHTHTHTYTYISRKTYYFIQQFSVNIFFAEKNSFIQQSFENLVCAFLH